MRATVLHGARDVRIETVPDASLIQPTDALVRVTRACICGSDLWPYASLEPTETGRRMGHKAIGVVEQVGPEVRTIKTGDVVVMPFAYSDGTCVFCHEGLHTACLHGGFFGTGGNADGAQAEALRVPQAAGTLFALPVGEDHALSRYTSSSTPSMKWFVHHGKLISSPAHGISIVSPSRGPPCRRAVTMYELRRTDSASSRLFNQRTPGEHCACRCVGRC